MRMLCMFYKIKTLKMPEYLYYLISNDCQTYNTQNLDFVETYLYRTDAFKYSFFLYSISEWNKLDQDLCNAKSYSMFRKSLLKFGQPSPNHIYKIHDSLDYKSPLSALRRFLRTESPLKMMKNAFYFMLKALFVLEIFTLFLSNLLPFVFWFSHEQLVTGLSMVNC